MSNPDKTPGGGASLGDVADKLQKHLSGVNTPKDWLLVVANASMQGATVVWEPDVDNPGQTVVTVKATPPPKEGV